MINEFHEFGSKIDKNCVNKTYFKTIIKSGYKNLILYSSSHNYAKIILPKHSFRVPDFNITSLLRIALK